MAQAIRLFRNILPNVDNSVHIRYTDVEDYLDFLAPNAVYDLTADNYRLNTNVLKVSLNHFLNYAIDYMEVTYVALEQTLDENYTKYVFYFVKNCYVQSGYVVYMLEEDIWATEQETLNQLKIVVNRCNAKLPNEVGIYDEIKKTETHRLDQSGQLYDTGYTRPLATQKFWNLNMFYVVFVVQWVTSRNLANTDYIKSTNTFAINLEDLLISMGDPTGHTTFKATDLACMCISGVTKTSTNVWGVTNDAKVIKAFIIPKNEGKIERNLGALTVNFIYRTWLTGNTDKTFTAYELRNTIEYFNYALSLTDFDANYKYYIGTYYNYMQLLNYMHNIDNDRYLNVRFVFMYSQSDVQIFIEQGNEQKEITNGFSIPLIANVEQTDVLPFVPVTAIIGAVIK